jgi:hypothetical protein
LPFHIAKYLRAGTRAARAGFPFIPSIAVCTPHSPERRMAKTYRLPKRLLGVKIPKPLRNLDWAVQFLESEVGRRILAEALVAAAAAASAALVGTQTEVGAKAGKKLSKAKHKGGDLLKNAVHDATGAVTNVIGNAARSMLAKDEEEGGAKPRRTAH